jgi:hypothetical protein
MIFDVHGSVHHNVNYLEITNKMRSCIRIYYCNVSYCSTFRATHRSSLRAQKLYLQPLVYICLWLPAIVRGEFSYDSGWQPQTYVNQRLKVQFLSSRR